jgi:hypothetical protein
MKGKMYMLTDYEREVATTLVEALCEYGLTENLEQYGERGAENWFWNNELGPAGFWASGGATKVCIGHDDLCGWVIKVGYTRHVKKDYATYEYNVYCAAAEAGLARYFPETIYLGEFCGRAFYVQQKAECDEDAVSSDWYTRLRDQYDEDGAEYDPDRLWDEIDDMDSLDKAMLVFGDEELCDFLSEHRVNDLHEANFGYIRGCMVIIDMAGFEG